MAEQAICSANDVMRYLVNKGIKNNNPLSQLQLQKLVVIAHGYHLAIVEKPLIKEAVEAWRYGPVIPEIYQALKAYGSGGIKDEMLESNALTSNKDAYSIMEKLTHEQIVEQGKFWQAEKEGRKFDSPFEGFYSYAEANFAGLSLPQLTALSEKIPALRWSGSISGEAAQRLDDAISGLRYFYKAETEARVANRSHLVPEIIPRTEGGSPF